MPTGKNPQQQFETIHKVGLIGLFNNYGKFKGLLTSFSLWCALVLSTLLLIFYINAGKSQNDILKFLDTIIDSGISVDGGLLGLSLAGLTLVVTFGSGNFMRTLVELSIKEAEKNKRFSISIYQSIIAKFGFAVFIQILTLITLIIFKIVSKMAFMATAEIASVVNFTAIFLSIFLLIYSLLLVAQMTINIFSVGQQNHMIYFNEVLDKESESSEQSQ